MSIQTTTPQNRLNDERRDCTICALTHVLGLSYEICYAIGERAGRRQNQGMHSKELLEECAKLGYKFKRLNLPKYGIAVHGASFVWPDGTLYLCTKRHAFAIKDGVIKDNGGLSGKNQFLDEAWQLVEVPDTKPERVIASKKTTSRFALRDAEEFLS